MQDAQKLKAEIISILDNLPVENLKLLVKIAKLLQERLGFNQSPPLPMEDDPLVGLFSGPTNLATQSEEILKHHITAKSGWTWKDQ